MFPIFEFIYELRPDLRNVVLDFYEYNIVLGYFVQGDTLEDVYERFKASEAGRTKFKYITLDSWIDAYFHWNPE